MVRRSDLDVLRGLLLLLMAVTHLPTRMSAYANQPLGFVSAAEGFVFLSAFLTGSGHATAMLTDGAAALRSRFFARAFKLYGYHLLLLLFAFTIAAAFAALTGRPALRNLLTFYFDSPVVAIVSAPLLLYQPPLFDILPMYIVFLALTPPLLAVAAREGWRNVLLLSALLWLFAQLGGRQLVHEALSASMGLHVPLEAGGAFDLFAWQLLWVVGLWLGNSFLRAAPSAPLSRRGYLRPSASPRSSYCGVTALAVSCSTRSRSCERWTSGASEFCGS